MQESFVTTAEVLTRLIVAITPLLPFLIKLIKDLRSPKEQAGTTTVPAVAQATPMTQPQRLSELSLALAYSALFSLLWAYAIGVSGQLPSWAGLILLSLVVTVFLTTLLILSWRRERLMLSLAALALISLFLVALTRGGPFLGAEGGEAAIASTMPLLIVLVVLSALLLYLRTRPIPRLSPKLVKRGTFFILLIGAGLVAVAGGVDFKRDLYEREKVLPLEDERARQLLLDVNGSSVAARRLFYQLGTEIVLIPFYLEQYLALSPQSGAAGSEPLEEPELDPESEEDFMAALFGMGSARGGRQCLDSGIFVEAAKRGSAETYMTNRLRWVHPVGDGKKARVEIPLLGKTAEDRVREAAKHRIYASLEGQEERKAKFLEICTYPADLRSALADDQTPNPLEALNPLSGGSDFDSDVMPELEPHSGNPILEIQMALPVAEESRTAFSQYRHTVLALEGPRIQNLANRFDSLDPDIRRAFSRYFEDPANRIKYYDLLRGLIEVQSTFESNFDPMTSVARLEAMLPPSLAEAGTAPTPVSSPGGAVAQPAAAPAFPGEEGGEDAAEEEDEEAFSERSSEGDDVEALGRAIVAHLGAIDRAAIRESLFKDFRELLKQNDPEIPVIHLFRRQSLDFVKEIYAQNLAENDIGRLFEICSRPIVPMIRKIIQRPALISAEERGDLEAALATFVAVPAKDQEAILHLLANQFYRIQEPEDLVAVSVATAGIYGYHLDVVVAMIFVLPVVLLAIWAGVYFSRALAARDVLRSSIAQEIQRGQSPLPPFAFGAGFVGRDPVLRQLANLAKRGWGTIALVGQRGIGKTRILQEAISAGGETGRKPRIGVWITAPARFDEREFVTSTLEQVSAQVERTVAHYLEAQPLAVRELEARLKWGWMAHLAVLVLVFNLLTAEIESSLSEPLMVLTLAPTFLVILAALCVGFLYWSRLQPVDLTSWLQERQSTHAHAVLMYREAIEVVQSLREVGLREASPLQRQVGTYQRGLSWCIGLLDLLIMISFLAQPTMIEGFLIAALSALWIWIRARRPPRASSSAESLMSLLRRYRDYIASVVRRLDMGAFGPEKRLGVVICIDELDKIVDLKEVREFVRRIKGMFEVPGVYYYVSLAEDTFGALYLGSIEGKNEIDSSFDHIVRILPLSADEAASLVEAQLERLGNPPLGGRNARAIAAISFGNPRDALRLCDELMASRSYEPSQGIADVIANRRLTEARSSYEMQRIRMSVYQILAGSPEECRAWARQFFSTPTAPGPGDEKVSPIVLGCWLLALIELALLLREEAAWLQATEEICEVGGQVALLAVEDLVPRVMAVDALVQRAQELEAPSAAVAS